jgi:hypothetical protein
MELDEVTSCADSLRRARDSPPDWVPGNYADSRLSERFRETSKLISWVQKCKTLPRTINQLTLFALVSDAPSAVFRYINDTGKIESQHHGRDAL